MRLRPMVEADLDTVVRIERSSFSTPWRQATFRKLLEREATELWVAEVDGKPIGHAVLWWVVDEGELANIAVAPAWRGRGVGTRLLDRVLDVARERGVRDLYLEVRVSNLAAARLYEARGFEEVGRRRDYYDRPREDARVLRKRLTDTGRESG